VNLEMHLEAMIAQDCRRTQRQSMGDLPGADETPFNIPFTYNHGNVTR